MTEKEYNLRSWMRVCKTETEAKRAMIIKEIVLLFDPVKDKNAPNNISVLNLFTPCLRDDAVVESLWERLK